MKTLKQRIYSAPADFFKPIVWFCGIAATIGAGIQVVPTDMLPAIFFEIGKYCLAAGIFGGAIAKLTVNEPIQKNGQVVPPPPKKK